MGSYGPRNRSVRTSYLGFRIYDNGAEVEDEDVQLTTVTDTRSGVSNPRYKAEIAAEVNAGTNFSGTKTHYQAGSFSIEERHPNPPDPPNPNNPILIRHSLSADGLVAYVGPNWDLWYFPKVPEPSEAIADAEALTKFVRNVREAQTAFQGGTFLGELTKTLALIRHPARELRRRVGSYLDRLRRIKRRNRNPRDRRSALADTWLEYSFGWTPLILDSYDAIELLERRAIRPKSKRVSGEGKHELDIKGGWFASYHLPGHSQVTFVGNRFKYYHVIYRGAVGIDWAQRTHRLRQAGLDWSNFVPTAWELMPYSFLIDYFTNIGDIISAATLNRAGLKWVMRTERYSEGYQAVGTPSIAQVASSWPVTRLEFQLPRGERTTVNRAPYNGSLVPRLRFEVPGFGLKWLNIGALIRNHRSLLPFF